MKSNGSTQGASLLYVRDRCWTLIWHVSFFALKLSILMWNQFLFLFVCIFSLNNVTLSYRKYKQSFDSCLECFLIAFACSIDLINSSWTKILILMWHIYIHTIKMMMSGVKVVNFNNIFTNEDCAIKISLSLFPPLFSLDCLWGKVLIETIWFPFFSAFLCPYIFDHNLAIAPCRLYVPLQSLYNFLFSVFFSVQ